MYNRKYGYDVVIYFENIKFIGVQAIKTKYINQQQNKNRQ